MYNFVSGFFAQLMIVRSVLVIDIAVVHSLLLLINIPLYSSTVAYLFNLMNGHLGRFQFGVLQYFQFGLLVTFLYMPLVAPMQVQLLGIYTKMELRGLRLCTYSTLVYNAKLFPSGFTNLHLH